jgi:hypothetical protein
MQDSGEAPVVTTEGEREAKSGVAAGAEQIDESDTEHEDLHVEKEPWPGLLGERTNFPRDAM